MNVYQYDNYGFYKFTIEDYRGLGLPRNSTEIKPPLTTPLKEYQNYRFKDNLWTPEYDYRGVIGYIDGREIIITMPELPENCTLIAPEVETSESTILLTSDEQIKTLAVQVSLLQKEINILKTLNNTTDEIKTN